MAFQATVNEICSAVSGKLFHEATGSIRVQGAVTDNREVTSGVVFFARAGETTDGHRFIEDAISRGATLCVVSKSWIESKESEVVCKLLSVRNNSVALISVSDPTIALGDLARYLRSKFPFPVFAVTGSNGKTTTKEMLRGVLSKLLGQGTASEKSFNNHVGLPLTILGASASDNWLVLEAGMNHEGELDYLGSIARPDVACVLNIGGAHMGHFSSLEEIADAKCELLAHVAAHGTVVVNNDDAVLLRALSRLQGKIPSSCHVKTFGLTSGAHYVASTILPLGENGIRFVLRSKDGEEADVTLPHVGRHNVMNALAVTAMLQAAFPEISVPKIAEAFDGLNLPYMRFEVTRGEYQGCKVSLINDAYNANPISMRVALQAATDFAGETELHVVLGDMRELGSHSQAEHQALGEVVASTGVSRLIVLGEFARDVEQGAKRGGMKEVSVVPDYDAASDAVLKGISSRNVVVLVKGSRGVALENVVERINQRLNALPSSLPPP